MFEPHNVIVFKILHAISTIQYLTTDERWGIV